MIMLKRDESLSIGMNYGEYITEAKCEGKLLARKILCIVITALFVLVGSWALLGGVINAPPLELLVLGAAGIGFFFASGSYKLEYEYIVASAQIEFDVIRRRTRRKEILTVSMDDISRIAPVNAETERYIASQNVTKFYDFCSSKKSARRYFLLARIGSENTVVYFDAIAKTLDVMKFFRAAIVEIDKEIYAM